MTSMCWDVKPEFTHSLIDKPNFSIFRIITRAPDKRGIEDKPKIIFLTSQ